MVVGDKCQNDSADRQTATTIVRYAESMRQDLMFIDLLPQ